MGTKCGMSAATVARIWQSFALSRTGTERSNGPEFHCAAQVHDIVRLYSHPLR